MRTFLPAACVQPLNMDMYWVCGVERKETVSDVGITLRVTIIALSCAAQLEAHEDTR
jgi:hypothetical protein